MPRGDNNPHDPVLDSEKWIKHEYKAQRGSMMELADTVRRFKLMKAILEDENVTPSVKVAMAYLLGTDGQDITKA